VAEPGTDAVALVWRDEGGGSQTAEGAGGGEPAAQEAVGGGGAGQGDSPGGLGGKLTSPARRREAVWGVQRKWGVSERRACRTLGQPRATQRYRPQPRELERRLVARMLELVREHPRYGYRRIWALLRREGWRVNRKRIYRLWRQEGLKVPQKPRKKRHLGQRENGCSRQQAQFKDHVWAWDFIHNRTCDGRPLKWLAVVDEYTRECLALEVGHGMKAEEVIDVLAELVLLRGVPKYIRSDNGRWLRKKFRGLRKKFRELRKNFPGCHAPQRTISPKSTNSNFKRLKCYVSQSSRFSSRYTVAGTNQPGLLLPQQGHIGPLHSAKMLRKEVFCLEAPVGSGG